MKYQFIAMHTVKRRCETLGASTSRYYAWRSRPDSRHSREDGVLKEAIKQISQSSRGCYGSPRVFAELQAQGYSCSRKRVARLMQEQGLYACQKRRCVHTTRQDPTHLKVENVLHQQFEACSPNQKWVADVTAVWTQQEWLYLEGVLDLFSRSLVGWAMSEK